jgi:hypothetical protein
MARPVSHAARKPTRDLERAMGMVLKKIRRGSLGLYGEEEKRRPMVEAEVSAQDKLGVRVRCRAR